jgi:hypothetical protein
MKRHYDKLVDNEYQADAYRIDGWCGIAWHILGWEIGSDEDTEWGGYEVRTGKLIAVMIGDDRHFAVDPDDVSELHEDDYCRVCGQIGCHCNY